MSIPRIQFMKILVQRAIYALNDNHGTATRRMVFLQLPHTHTQLLIVVVVGCLLLFSHHHRLYTTQQLLFHIKMLAVMVLLAVCRLCSPNAASAAVDTFSFMSYRIRYFVLKKKREANSMSKA